MNWDNIDFDTGDDESRWTDLSTKKIRFTFQKQNLKLATVTCIWNPSIQETESGGLLEVGGQPELRSESEASLHYKVRDCLKTKTNQKDQPYNDITYIYNKIKCVD